jgi:DNA-binding FrmR family transcriptional regulator
MRKSKKVDCCDKQHPDHSKELSRLNRVSGQIEGVKRMIGEREYCPDILTQLRAIRAAVNSLEANILETHIDSCVTDALNAGSEKEKVRKIAELKELYRRFNE